jgi:hypothetical protein
MLDDEEVIAGIHLPLLIFDQINPPMNHNLLVTLRSSLSQFPGIARPPIFPLHFLFTLENTPRQWFATSATKPIKAHYEEMIGDFTFGVLHQDVNQDVSSSRRDHIDKKQWEV